MDKRLQWGMQQGDPPGSYQHHSGERQWRTTGGGSRGDDTCLDTQFLKLELQDLLVTWT